MEILKKKYILILYGFSLLVCALWSFKFFYEYIPYWTYQFDLHAQDSTYYHLVERMLKNLPIYGDWQRSDVISMTPPFYLYWLSLGIKFDWNVFTWARVSNTVFLFLGVLLLTLINARLQYRQRSPWIGLSTLFVFYWLTSHLDLFNAQIFLTPDALLFFCHVLALYLILFHPRQLFLLLLLCMITFSSAIYGAFLMVAIPLTLLLINQFENQMLNHSSLYGFNLNKYFFRFIGQLFVALILFFVYWQIRSQGTYFGSTILHPLMALGNLRTFSKWQAELNVFYQQWWIIGLVFLGFIHFLNNPQWPRPLVIFYIVDGLGQLVFGRNETMLSSLWWTHWGLTILIAAHGLELLLALIPSLLSKIRENIFKEKSFYILQSDENNKIVLMFVLFIFILKGISTFHYAEMKLNRMKLADSFQLATAANQQFIEDLQLQMTVNKNQFAADLQGQNLPWLAAESFLPLVTLGRSISVDMQLINQLLKAQPKFANEAELSSQSFALTEFKANLLKGHFQLLYHFDRPVAVLQNIIDSCFREIWHGRYFTFNFGQFSPEVVTIKQFDKHSLACLRIQTNR